MTKLRKWIVLLALTILWACGSPEQAAVDQFFRAAQTSDHVTLAYMSAVGPPLEEIESWSVVEVSSRTTEPFELPKLLEEFEEAETERDASLEERKKYFEDNQDALEQVIPKLQDDPEYEFRGSLGEVQTEWTRLADDRRVKEQHYQELKRDVDRYTRTATKSLMRDASLKDLTGDVSVTEMLLNLKPAEGEELPFKATLHKYNLTNPDDMTEPARWVIVDFEGTTEAARAAAASAAERTGGVRSPTAVPSEAVPSGAAAPEAAPSEAGEPAEVAEAESPPSAPAESGYLPKELRGEARVHMLAPETKVEGNEAVTTLRIRNASRDWITRFTVTEHWYDESGNALRSTSRTHQERFMPGEVVTLELRTRRDANFYQSQFEFTHANGKVSASVVASLPTE